MIFTRIDSTKVNILVAQFTSPSFRAFAHKIIHFINTCSSIHTRLGVTLVDVFLEKTQKIKIFIYCSCFIVSIDIFMYEANNTKPYFPVNKNNNKELSPFNQFTISMNYINLTMPDKMSIYILKPISLIHYNYWIVEI